LRTQKLQAKISIMKEEREYKSSIAGKSIAEELDEEDGGAVAWVKKSRILAEDQIKKEKELAQQRAKMLDEQDEDFEESDEETKKKSAYSTKDLKGLKIGHNIEEIAGTEQVILTLKDTPILVDKDHLNEDDDELENYQLLEKEKIKKNAELKKKKPLYDVYGDQNSLLPQYDEEKKKEGVFLNEHGMITNEAEMEAVKKKTRSTSRKRIV